MPRATSSWSAGIGPFDSATPGLCVSYTRALATENQRRSAVEYVFLVEGCTVHVYSAWPIFNCRVR